MLNPAAGAVDSCQAGNKKGTGPHMPKIGSPQILDQSGRDMISGQDQFDNQILIRIIELIESISSQNVSER